MKMILLLLLGIGSAAHGARYDEALAELEKIREKYSGYSTWMSLGKNDQETEIKGIHISKPDLEEPERWHLVVGTHHGNELGAADTSLAFAKVIFENLKSENATYHQQLKNDRITLIPVLNVTGYNEARREERDGSQVWRDPNRDYPDPCAEKTDFYLKSTYRLAEYVRKNSIVNAVTIHGYIGTLTYPWGIYTSQTKTDDHEAYDRYAAYAAEANGYRVGTHTDVIYPAAGAFEDWAYHELGIWVHLLEIKRRSSLKKDALALTRLLSVSPKKRSEMHAHKGQCTRTFAAGAELPSRP